MDFTIIEGKNLKLSESQKEIDIIKTIDLSKEKEISGNYKKTGETLGNIEKDLKTIGDRNHKS